MNTLRGRGIRTRNKIVVAIRDIWERKGLRPTIREVAREVGVTHSVAYHHIKKLHEMGEIARQKGTARSLRLTPAGEERLREARCLIDLEEERV